MSDFAALQEADLLEEHGQYGEAHAIRLSVSEAPETPTVYLLDWWWRVRYGPKHDYVRTGTVTSFAYIGCVWPVHTCSKCGDQTSLDGWQIANLPPSMAYGCKS